MKKFVLILMVLFLTAGVAFAKDYEITKKAGDYTVQIRMDRNPPVVGANQIAIDGPDQDGQEPARRRCQSDRNRHQGKSR
ncbi:MAG: hypothetical protein NTZ57_03755 [Deltaproteobacteria bacterium]|nr:hypothetical protein [Deltaproteobacteria bacterium]